MSKSEQASPYGNIVVLKEDAAEHVPAGGQLYDNAVLLAWITRSNPHQTTVRCYPYRHACLEANPRYHHGKAARIYRRHSKIIDMAIQ